MQLAPLDGRNVDELIEFDLERLEVLDKWIVSRLHKLIKKVTSDFENYILVLRVDSIIHWLQETLLWLSLSAFPCSLN